MKLIQFPEQTVIFAENQPEYLPLPAYQYYDVNQTIVFCWQLTIMERLKVLFSGVLWNTVLTFGKPLQPVIMEVDKPHMPRIK